MLYNQIVMAVKVLAPDLLPMIRMHSGKDGCSVVSGAGRDPFDRACDNEGK